MTGSPLTEVITQGLERPKFAADCLNVLMRELKLHCQEGTPGFKNILGIYFRYKNTKRERKEKRKTLENRRVNKASLGKLLYLRQNPHLKKNTKREKK